MARRPRSPARAALSRAPTWITVLGTVLVLGELAGAAALLTAGGPARTVVLRVDGGHAGCNPPGSCGPQVSWDLPGGAWGIPSAVMPFTRTVRVPVGGSVRLYAFSATQDWAVCWITVNGTVVSRAATYKTWGRAVCQTRIG